MVWTTPTSTAKHLYTQPEEVAYAYEQLGAVSSQFTVAAAFGNVHGVYKPGNVELTPVILKNSQAHIAPSTAQVPALWTSCSMVVQGAASMKSGRPSHTVPSK